MLRYFRHRLAPLLAMFAMAAIALCALGAPKAPKDDMSEARLKARYYYLEGLRHQTQGNNPQAFEYYRRAHQTDPTYAEAASAFAMLRLAANLDTLQSRAEVTRALRLMRPFVDQYPDDNYEALYYAFIASRVDSINEAIRVYQRTYDRRPDLTDILINLSDAYMAAGNRDKAIEEIDRYEAIEGMNPQLTIRKISYRMAALDTLGAIAEATALVNYNPLEPAYRILKGNMFELAGQKDSTLVYFRQAEELNPDYGAAKLALAEYYRQQGDSTAYDAKTYEALLSEDFDLEQKIYLLEEYLQKIISDKQNTARGDHLFAVLSDQYPHEPAVLDLAARYSAAKGDFKKACEEISYAIDLSPTEERYRQQLISYLVADDRPLDAMKAYRQAIGHLAEPSHGLKVLYASAAQIADRYDEAVDTYGEVIRDIAPGLPVDSLLKPVDIPATLSYEDLQMISQLFTSIGDCRYGEKKLDEAFRAYDNALLLFPDNTLALNNYAYFLSENDGDLDKAAEMSKKSLAGENAENPTYLDTYAWILFKKGDFDEAAKYQAAAVEAAEKDGSVSAELYDHYGDILDASGNREKALENWQKALDLEPDNSEIKTKIKDNARK